MSGSELPDPLAHRSLLGEPLVYEPFARTDLLARLGGQVTVDRLADLLYDGFEADPVLRPLFPRDLTGGRAGQIRSAASSPHSNLGSTHPPNTPASYCREIGNSIKIEKVGPVGLEPTLPGS